MLVDGLFISNMEEIEAAQDLGLAELPIRQTRIQKIWFDMKDLKRVEEIADDNDELTELKLIFDDGDYCYINKTKEFLDKINHYFNT